MIEELDHGLLQSSQNGQQSLVPLHSGGQGTPLFCIHGLGGHVGSFMHLARGLTRARAGVWTAGAGPIRRPTTARSH